MMVNKGIKIQIRAYIRKREGRRKMCFINGVSLLYIESPSSPGGPLREDDRRMMDNLLEKLRSGETENRQRRERRTRQQRRMLQQQDGSLPSPSSEEEARRKRDNDDDEDDFLMTEISAADLLKNLQAESTTPISL